MALLGLFAACAGTEDDETVDVQSIDAILDGEIAVEDIGTQTATLRVRTTVAVACSVVYGRDTSYGSVSTDMDMGGAAHTNHTAVMGGLEPDTTYHYRLQGTGPDGTMYVSDDRTFRTPEEDDNGRAARPNLASLSQGASIADASSEFGDGTAWAAENAIDEDIATEWSSDGDGDDAFITVQLAGPADVTGVGLRTRTMGTTAQIESFRVITDEEEVLGPFTLPGAEEFHVFDVSAQARTLRFEVVTSSGGNTGIVDIVVYGDPAQ